MAFAKARAVARVPPRGAALDALESGAIQTSAPRRGVTGQAMTTSKTSGPAGGDRRQTVDFDLFGGEAEAASDAAAAAAALERTAGQVDFDVFGAAEAAADVTIDKTTEIPMEPVAKGVDFDIFGAQAAGSAAQETVTVMPDTDMDAEDATRFTAPPTPGQAAAAAPHVAPASTPAAAPARAAAPASEAPSNTGKIIALVIVIAAIAAAAWFLLR
ncbi:MAG: hypothetical protein HY749_10565 [Gammaproteobacteria bacterium]|nr:hypothetical protein [Gammaproteobacteria bacterium]MBI5615640.1 hypothetical protein [Gammaproteobacteria bacterium]